MKQTLSLAILLSFSAVVYAQRPLKNIHDGNKLYLQKKYDEAGVSYAKALEADSTNVRAIYNSVNSIYKMGEYETAIKGYNALLSDQTLNKKLNTSQKSDLYHNLGNSYLKKEQYEDGIKAYKEALKLKPGDTATKYNLAYALQKLQQQQQNQQNQDQKNDKNNQDQKQQQQQNQENKNDQNQNRQQQQQQEQNQPQKPEQKQGQQPDKMKKSDAERMLNAMDKQEKNTLDKKKKIKVEQRVKTDKDW